MHHRTQTICIALTLAGALLASHSVTAEEKKPCLKIKEACEQAGFKFGSKIWSSANRSLKGDLTASAWVTPTLKIGAMIGPEKAV